MRSMRVSVLIIEWTMIMIAPIHKLTKIIAKIQIRLSNLRIFRLPL